MNDVKKHVPRTFVGKGADSSANTRSCSRVSVATTLAIQGNLGIDTDGNEHKGCEGCEFDHFLRGRVSDVK